MSSLVSKGVLILGGIILARILPVEDFGYLLTLNIIYGFINLFSISGYEFYFIQNRGHTEYDEMILLRQVFNLRVLQSVFLFIVTNIVAFVQYYIGNETLGILLGITSLLFLISLISKPEESFLSKNLEYKTISASKVFKDIVASISKVFFAVLGFGALSFGIGNVLGGLAYSSSIKYKHNLNLLKKVGWKKKVEPYSKIRKFGFHLFLNTAGSFLTKQADKIFIVSFFDQNDKGYYQFANNYAAYPFNMLIAPQNSMVLSLMSKHREKPKYLMQLFDNFGIISGIVLFPLFFLLFYYCPEIFEFVFGSKWLAAVTLFRIFLIYYFLKIIFYPSNGILTSFGRPDIKAKVTIGTFIVCLPTLLYLSLNSYSIIYYALVFVVLSTISDLICFYYGFRLMGESTLKFLSGRFRFIYISAFLWILLHMLNINYQGSEIIEVSIAIVITMSVIYISIVLHAKKFLDAFHLFIKNDRINRLLRKVIFFKS